MSYLITQIFILLLIAGLLGLVLGWYLTRIASAGAQAALQARLDNAENDARGLRAELDAAVNARGVCEAERTALADRLAALQDAQAGSTSADPAAPEPVPPAAATAAAPPAMDAAQTAADDLQQIKGIGPKIAAVLTELGILRYAQIAAWTPDNIAWVNEHLRFKGRIEREEWIAQAKALQARREQSD